MNNKPEVIEKGDWDKLFWSFNLPLQMWPSEGGGHRFLNYMPRKERFVEVDNRVTDKELPAFCQTAANHFRHMANLFEALGRGEIDTIYYHDQGLDEHRKVNE